MLRIVMAYDNGPINNFNEVKNETISIRVSGVSGDVIAPFLGDPTRAELDTFMETFSSTK